MSFFVSESIKNRIDEETFVSPQKTHMTFVLTKNNSILFKVSSFESIDYKKGHIIKIIFKLTYDIIKTIINDNSCLLLEVNADVEKKYNVELEKITNLNDNNYYCSFNNLKEIKW